MADDKTSDTQDETKDETKTGDQSDTSGETRDERDGEADKPGAALLKALAEEWDARREAERKLKQREKADRDAETARAVKAGEWESVAKAKDTEIADLTARVAELQGEIASAKLETVRERVAAKHKLRPELAARLVGTDEASLEADAKALAKLIPPPSSGGGTEAGAGANGSGTKQTVAQIADELRKSGRYASVG